MPADPTIRAALEAAERAISASYADAWASDRAMAAAAVAAFLRALPERYSDADFALRQQIPPCDDPRLWLAAAVEEAARHG